MWQTQNCTADIAKAPPLLVVNSLHVDLAEPSVRLVALAAEDSSSGNATLATLPAIATQATKLLGGINGGYFWRVDVEVCALSHVPCSIPS